MEDSVKCTYRCNKTCIGLKKLVQFYVSVILSVACRVEMTPYLPHCTSWNIASWNYYSFHAGVEGEMVTYIESGQYS